MAMKKTATAENPWDNPIWPEQLPDAKAMRVAFGAFADELVVRFADRRHHAMVIVVPVATPEYDYAGMLVAEDSGAVLGVHVYPLVAYAVEIHPAWQQLAEPDPEPAAVLRVVEDIRALFDRHGIDPDESDLD